MLGKSHIQLGEKLADQYLSEASSLRRKLFLWGCIEPDRNPLSYLKGSASQKWLRGHNYENSQHFLLRIAQRLEQRQHLSLWDFYTAGKLIHYTADAFTYPHNQVFPPDLTMHRKYEVLLQQYFLRFLSQTGTPPGSAAESLPDLVQNRHARYLRKPGTFLRDSRYAYFVSCRIMRTLSPKV